MTYNFTASYHLLLELKLRRASGNQFQVFFGDIMEEKRGNDYVRVKPYGKLGDKGCDGYLESTGSVFACYGAQNGVAGSVSYLISKMTDDFGKAKSNLGDIMRSWHMVHNIIEGLPVETIQKINALKKENTDIELSLLGPPNIADIMAAFSESGLEKFLGPAARNKDFRNLQMSEVKELVDANVSVTTTPPMTDLIDPVSFQKIQTNHIPAHWAALLQGGRMNEHHIQDYFQEHQIPTRGETLAAIFRDRYAELVAERLSPGAILDRLFIKIVGSEEVNRSRQVAAYTLLAYLFERCDIFENALDGGNE